MTLKTCTRMNRAEEKPKRVIRQRTQTLLPRYGRAYYSEGPKTKELKSYEDAATLLTEAQRLLPNTKVGVSVLSTFDENFQDLKDLCPSSAFWELNLKYSMRSKDDAISFFGTLTERWDNTLKQIDNFLTVFADKPVFIKLSRELEWLPNTEQATSLLDKLSNHGDAGLIIANSRKIDIGPFIDQDEEVVLAGGVIAGDPLFDSTLKMIEGLAQECKSRVIPIVATGGMVDEQQVLMALRAGADAVQLCTAFDYNGHGFYQTLIDALRARIKWRGLRTLDTYVTQLRTEGIASVFSMPTLYFRAFWSEGFQKQIQQDIRFSRRMDFVLMSGRTVFNEWEGILSDRIKSRFYSVRALSLNPESKAFSAIQQTWGIVEPNEIKARQQRILSAKAWLDRLFNDGLRSLAVHIQERNAEYEKKGEPPLSPALMKVVNTLTDKELSDATQAELLQLLKRENEQRRRDDLERLPSPEWGSKLYDKVPFYSMYIFDDKACVSMYPFMRPGKLASPVYVYFRSSSEYSRLAEEFEMLWTHAAQPGMDSTPTVLGGGSSLDEVE